MRRLILVLTTFLLSSCVRKDRATSSLEVLLTEDPQTLDTSFAENESSWLILAQLEEGLVTPDAKGQPSAGLAESWKVLPDGKTIRFHLKEVRWSDGVSLEADHFRQAWLRTLDPRIHSPHAALFFDIEGAKAYHEGQTKAEPAIKVVAARDLEVKTGSVNSLLEKLSRPPTFPVRPDVIASHPANHSDPPHLRSIGPYRLSQWDRGHHLVLEPNPYYPVAPRLARVQFRISRREGTKLSSSKDSWRAFLRMPAAVP